jgi:ubiquinone/menaquinone biosynthesis C-methylase UbiE
MSEAFDAFLKTRNAEDYADFLLPHLARDLRVLDIGCGRGTITLGLAEAVGDVIGVDLDGEEFAEAQRHAADHEIANVEFRVGSVYALDFPADHFDACLCHSMLQTLARPLDGLVEIKRVLKPGGIVGAASVEYGGLILAGPNEDLLRRFYTLREQLWLAEGEADPFRGRRLRALLERSGFKRVVASSKFFSYGTGEAVEWFGRARADDCRSDWYVHCSRKHGLATENELDEMSRAWVEWSHSPDAYLAFAWCRALGIKPT